ncbi:transposable element Tc1 transposase [Trichonephila clavipes]|nr:transposable element Tc1 transposase [Trichonephila clavipes]
MDPAVTRSTIRADVSVAIVPQTISRHFAEVNLKSKRPFRALPLTPEHRQLRLQWCEARSMWNVTDWQKIVFSEESRFVLGTDDNRVQKLLGAVDTRRYPRVENRVLSDQEDHLREDRRIVRQALVDPTVTRSTIRADVGVAIVPQTISRHLAEANLKSKHPFRALPLTPEHRLLRLQWCQARSMWNVTDWQKVVFSDESRFVLGQMITVHGCGGALVSGPFLNGHPGAIFQQDNARPHTARVAQDILRHFQTLPLPARSPDLSPVEDVWDQPKRKMPSCHSVHDLELAVQDL